MPQLTRRNTLLNFVFAVLALGPLLLLGFHVFRLGFDDSVIALCNTQMWYGLSSVPWLASIYDFVLNDFLDGQWSTPLAEYTISYFLYLCVLTCVDLMFMCVIKLLSFLRSFLDRLEI